MPRGMRRISRRPNLAQQTYDALCDAIATGNLRPGERIVLDRLAADLGVSPTPLREAIARLIQDGLMVDNADGKLCVVPLTAVYVHNTFWVRASLEGLATELACAELSDDDLERLETMFHETSESLDRGELDTYVRADAVFHQLTSDAANNSVLERELDSLKTHVAYIRGYSQRQNGEHIRASQQEHLIILEALKRREAKQARDAMEIHIRRTSDRIVRLIEFDQHRMAVVGDRQDGRTSEEDQ